MTVVAKGFDETLTEQWWAEASPHAGAPYSVVSGLELRINESNRPRVVVQAGVALVCGVQVTVVGEEVVDFTAPTGTTATRWDLLALRVNWQTNTAEAVVVTGGATRALPSSRQRTPGDVYDFPILLVRLNAGDQRIVDSVDLRAGASKLISVRDTLALPAPFPGGQALVGPEGAGAPYAVLGGQWQRNPGGRQGPTGSDMFVDLNGWTSSISASPIQSRSWIDDVTVSLTVALRRTGAPVQFSTSHGALSGGSSNNQIVGRLTGSLRPVEALSVAATFFGGSDTSARDYRGCTVEIDAEGGIRIVGGPAGQQINPSGGSEVAMRFGAMYRRNP